MVKTGSLECDRDYLSEFISDRDPASGTYVFLRCPTTDAAWTAKPCRAFSIRFSTKADGRGLGLGDRSRDCPRPSRGDPRLQHAWNRNHHQGVVPRFRPGRGALAPPRTSRDPLGGSGKILVADDEEMVRELARRVLEEAGLRSCWRADGREAVQLFQQHPRDIAWSCWT